MTDDGCTTTVLFDQGYEGLHLLLVFVNGHVGLLVEGVKCFECFDHGHHRLAGRVKFAAETLNNKEKVDGVHGLLDC